MLLNLGYILLIIALLLVLYFDMKKRMIHIILPILIFCFSMLINYVSTNLKLIDTIYNIGFLLINILGVILYFSLKTKALINPIDRFIGLGDIVFFIAITPLFKLETFIPFFIIGLLFSLLLYVIVLLFKKMKTIPLAGYLSLYLVINILIKNVFNINMSI
ncbi:general secretion pathway protein [Flavivirga amylovorans]